MTSLISREFVSSVAFSAFGWHIKGEKSQGWIYFSAKTTQRYSTLPKLANGISGSGASDGYSLVYILRGAHENALLSWAQTWVRLRSAYACFLGDINKASCVKVNLKMFDNPTPRGWRHRVLRSSITRICAILFLSSVLLSALSAPFLSTFHLTPTEKKWYE